MNYNINTIYLISVILIVINILSNSILKYGIAEDWWNFALTFVFLIGIFILYRLIFFYLGKRMDQIYIIGLFIFIIAMGSFRLYWHRISENADERNYTLMEIISNAFGILAVVVFLVGGGDFANSRRIVYLVAFGIAILFSLILYINLLPFNESNYGGTVSASLLLFLMVLTGLLLVLQMTKIDINPFMVMIICGIVFLFLTGGILAMKNFSIQQKKDTPTPKPPPPFDPDGKPADIVVDEAVLKEIMRQLKNFEAIDNCQSSRSNSCAYLFEEMISRPTFNYQELDDVLNTMQKDALKNQNVYLLYQLLQCRLKLEGVSKREIHRFGTLDWYYANNFGNLFQTFIYFVSLIVFLGIFAYSVYRYRVELNGSHFLPAIIVVILVVAINFGALLSQVRAKDETVYDVPNNMKPYLKEKEKETDGTGRTATITALSLTVAIAVILSLIGFFLGRGLITLIATAVWLGLVLVLNLYYGILIPQAVVIAMLLQAFILATPLRLETLTDTGILVVKAVIFVVILIASLYDTQYRTQTAKTAEGEKARETPTVANQPIWLLFGLITVLLLANVAGAFFNFEMPHGGGIDLVLMPIVKIITGGKN